MKESLMLPPILFEGSVKNVRGVKGRAPYIFEYSDRYSVFDWGAMPDLLVNKGDSLAFMGNLFFTLLGNKNNWSSWQAPAKIQKSKILEKFKRDGVLHHCLGLDVDNEQANLLVVNPVQILEPTFDREWDYSAYQKRPTNVLVPLEVIFRFGVPEGSSLLSRTKDSSYCSSIGLSKEPKIGDRFDFPVIEFSTKLESSDRYLPYSEARAIAGMSEEEFQNLIDYTSLVALRLKDLFQNIEIELWDGKFEYAFSKDRSLMMVDSIGPDELRLIYKGKQLSKERLRTFYRDSSWYHAVAKAKSLASERGTPEWKEICLQELKESPKPLDRRVSESFSLMYQALCNELSQKYLGYDRFLDIPKLAEIVERI